MGNEMKEGRYWKEEKDVQCGSGLKWHRSTFEKNVGIEGREVRKEAGGMQMGVKGSGVLDRVQKEKNDKKGGREEGRRVREWKRDRREGKRRRWRMERGRVGEREREREKPYFYKKKLKDFG